MFKFLLLNCPFFGDRAIEVAVKHKTHVDTVLYHRKKYLSSMNKEERNEKFLQYKEVCGHLLLPGLLCRLLISDVLQVELDEEKIITKMKLECEKDQ